MEMSGRETWRVGGRLGGWVGGWEESPGAGGAPGAVSGGGVSRAGGWLEWGVGVL